MYRPGVKQKARDAKTDHVLVLGAGGQVGRVIAKSIDAHAGLAAIAGLHHPPRTHSFLEVRLADATDHAALVAALDGCSYAVNAVGGSPNTLRQATRAICRAAREVGLKRLVHISSMAVYGSAATGVVTESSPFAAAPNAYEASKIDCEATVRHHIRVGHDAVILRPGLVFGPGSNQWAGRIARLLAAGRLGDLGVAGDGFCNLTHEADLGQAAVAALLAPGAAGLAINLAASEPLSWNDFLTRFGLLLGATPIRRITARQLGLEARVLAPALRLAGLAARRAGLGATAVPDAIPPSLLRLFAQRMRADPQLADRVLGVSRTRDADAMEAAALALAA